ncbi:MAG: hypothetical protein KDI13_01750 [Alphaproteobacteria bacterium]|nr:hypothetical protein [Alphaproteobacteria bacterium]
MANNSFRNQVAELFKIAARALEDTRQFKPYLDRIYEDVIGALRLNASHDRREGTLEEALSLKNGDSRDPELVSRRIAALLPYLCEGYADCLSFSRMKDVDRLADKKKTQDRDTYDIYGIQLWLSDANLMKAVEAWESPKHPLRKVWEKKGITVKIDNFIVEPKRHGYRAIHLNFTSPGSKGKSANLEIQIHPAAMMHTYLATRIPYKIFRSLKESLEIEKGKLESNWNEHEKNVVHTLREYINALYEAETHKAGLIDRIATDHSNGPRYQNEKEAREAAEKLAPTVDGIIKLYNAYCGRLNEFLEAIEDANGHYAPSSPS